jgi:outer membrane protein TolC
MKLARFFLIVSAAALLAGCMSAQTPTDSTTPWTPPKAAQNSDNIWDSARAQKIDFSKSLTLAELADIALQNNPASRKAWNDARAAAAQVSQAQGYFMPTLVANAGAGRDKTTAEPDTFDSSFTRYGPGLQVNYLILNFGGGRKAAVEAALQTVYAANYSFNRSIQDILLAVETAYYGSISAQAGAQAAEAGVKDAHTALEAAQIRKSAGAGAELEVLQAQAVYDQSLYSLAGAQEQVMIARGDLAQAIGAPADTELRVAEPTVSMADSLDTPDMRKLIDEALNRRPDVAALRATLAAKKAIVRAVGSELWPSLYFNGNLNRDYFKNISGKDMQESDWSYSGGISLQWTLFDGFQTLGDKRIAQAQADSLQAQLEQTELAASAEVWARYHHYETALRKYKFSAAYLNSASSSYDLALDSYKAGLKSILDLLNAESQLAQARSQQITARQETFTALANLAYSTGLLEKGGSAETRDLFSTPIKKDDQP